MKTISEIPGAMASRGRKPPVACSVWCSPTGGLRPRLAIVLFLISATPVRAQLPQFNLVHSLPPQSPPWLAGYQARWPVRIVGDPVKLTAKSVLVSLPTGGWLKPDASDLVVQTADGKLPLFQVVSHDPAGETIIQF